MLSGQEYLDEYASKFKKVETPRSSVEPKAEERPAAKDRQAALPAAKGSQPQA